MDFTLLDRRPIVVALAGPNGAGKTTFYHAHLAGSGLPFVNADMLSRELNIDPYAGARAADALRRALVARGASFIFETVLSDPVGDKVAFLQGAVQQGYSVVLLYLGLESAVQSAQRVSLRVSQGGHAVPEEKLHPRFARTLDNLRLAISRLPYVLVYDNSDLRVPFRETAAFEHGRLVRWQDPIPEWLRSDIIITAARENAAPGPGP